MEFRPLIEMTPESLEPLVKMELDETQRLEQQELPDAESIPRPLPVKMDDTPSESSSTKNHLTGRTQEGISEILGSGRRRDATNRIILKWQAEIEEDIKREESEDQTAKDTAKVDVLSLSVLVAQGFEETAAKNALLKFDNDAQIALDYLTTSRSSAPPIISDSGEINQRELAVRLPTSLRWVRKLRERRKQDNQKKAQRGEDAPKSTTSKQTDPTEEDHPEPKLTIKIEIPSLLDLDDEEEIKNEDTKLSEAILDTKPVEVEGKVVEVVDDDKTQNFDFL
eukprot:GHVP01055108.1.p1 GENE.GHVP01055108.1~~GHVP01055108.1.p1  ORF type:complete len:281 (+),score=81.34 GHVP01055108.1:1095-1937(+)